MKLRNLLTAGIVGISMLIGSASLAFTDTVGHWGDSIAKSLSHAEVISGYPDGGFRPDNNITRAEASKLICGILEDELIAYDGAFNDLDENDWSSKYIATLNSKGVAGGYGDGSFKPNNNITRAEFAKMVNAVLSNEGALSNNTQSFGDLSNHWANSSVSSLAGNSLVNGYEDGSFRPDNNITRAEASAIVYKSIKLVDSDRLVDFAPTEVTENSFQEATVVRVVDGDTVVVNLNGEEHDLRMIGIDTPESVHPDSDRNTACGVIASDYTKSRLASGSTVYLQKDVSEFDQYGRLLRYVWTARPTSDNPTEAEIRANMYNAELVLNGYAKPYTYAPDLKYVDLFGKFVGEAKAANTGLWSGTNECTPNGGKPLNPNNQNQGQNPNAPSGSGAINPPSNAGYNEKAYLYAEGRIIAKVQSGIYHLPGQQSYNKILVKNAVYFNTPEEAQAAGYRQAYR